MNCRTNERTNRSNQLTNEHRGRTERKTNTNEEPTNGQRNWANKRTHKLNESHERKMKRNKKKTMII